MEIKLNSYLVLELERNEKLYRFEMPFGAKYEDARIVAHDFVRGVEELQKQAEEQLKKSQEPEIKEYEVAPEGE